MKKMDCNTFACSCLALAMAAGANVPLDKANNDLTDQSITSKWRKAVHELLFWLVTQRSISVTSVLRVT